MTPGKSPLVYAWIDYLTIYIFINLCSNYPTGKPTYNVDNFRDSTAWKYYQGNLTSLSLVSNSYTFGSFFYKGFTKDGTCNRWTDFVENQLQIPYDDIVITYVSLWSYIYDFRTKSPRLINARCDNRNSISGIVHALNSGLDYCKCCDTILICAMKLTLDYS